MGNMPAFQVEPEHLLLGIMSVNKSGLFGQVSIEAARREVQSTLNPGKIRPPASPHKNDVDFSAHARKLFESAQIVSETLSFSNFAADAQMLLYCKLTWHTMLQESKRTGMSTITVEHLVIALLHNGSTCRGIIARWAQCLYVGLFTVAPTPDPQSCAAAGLASVQTLSKPVHTRSCKVIKRQRVPRRKSQYVLLGFVVVSHCLCYISQHLVNVVAVCAADSQF